MEYWRQRGVRILLFEDYGQVSEFIEAIGRDEGRNQTAEEATRMLAAGFFGRDLASYG